MAERGIIFRDDFASAPDKSWFDMSFDFLYSGNFGELIPSACMECMPEDVLHAKTDSFIRLSPLVAPTFGKVNAFNYHFYVRNRSIWTQWESFITDKDQRKSWQQANPMWTPPEHPYIDVRQVLFRGNLFGIGEAANLLSFDSDLTSYHIDATDAFNPQGVRHLVIFVDDQGSVPQYRQYEVLDIGNYRDFGMNSFDPHARIFVFSYIPNKFDVSAQQDSLKFYNVFSNGTLFDYLGVDISGVTADMRTLLGQIEDEIQGTDAYQDLMYFSTNTFIERTGFDYATFLRTHVLVSLSMIDDHGANAFTYNVGSGKVNCVGDFANMHDIPARYDVDSETSKISSLPLRAYHSIYIDYFRDENYISVNPCVDFSRDGNDVDWSQSSQDVFDYLTLNYKAYEHDPYTSALPQAQRGEAVRFLPDAELLLTDSVQTQSQSYTLRIGPDGAFTGSTQTASATGYDVLVDLSAATIENLRFANALQQLRETEARSGGRYYELMKAIFGADIEDAKIDRPVYLGGDKSPIQVSEVLQTSATEVSSDQPLGQMAGRAVSIGSDDYLEYVTPDHGFFIEISVVLQRTNYQQGILPMFTRKVRLDYAIPKFAQLGEQQVPQSELWYSAIDDADKKPFGYQSRYYDMKYQRDRTSGAFKDSLSHWTWSRIFDSAPIAGQKFLEVHPDYRQFAVTDESAEHVYVHMWHDLQVNRSLPIFGLPKL